MKVAYCGVEGAFAHIAKRQGFSLSPSAIKNTPVKDWAIFRLYDKKNPLKKDIVLEAGEFAGKASNRYVMEFARKVVLG